MPHEVTVDGARLTLHEWGAPDARPVLFWHPLGPASAGRYANELGPVLAERGFHVVAPDGSYTFAARGWDAAPSCSETECTCTPDATGSCTMNTWEAFPGTPVEATGTLSYPADGIVEIVFQ